MRRFIGAKTLQFLSIKGLYKSLGFEKRNPLYPQFTDHCFTGDYPVEPIDAKDKSYKEEKMSLMTSKI
jgi:amidophosphoribosyltransferase